MVEYRVLMTYPNGKVEEIQEVFAGLDEARQYATRLLNQVGFNSSFKDVLEDDNGRKNVKPYFVITAKKDGESMIVFDSRQK